MLLFSSSAAVAQNSGASFLGIGTGAKPAAMGEAYTAIAGDVNSLYYNPAGLATLDKHELSATYAQWLGDSNFQFIGYAQPTPIGTVGLGFTRLGNTALDGRDPNRQSTGNFTAEDEAYVLGFSHVLPVQLPDSLGGGVTSAGINGKYLYERIGSYSASSEAVDLGLLHQFGRFPLSFGFAILNIGRDVTFISQSDPLPLTFAAGFAYKPRPEWTIAVDATHEGPDNFNDIRAGVEYWLLPELAMRAGYNTHVRETSIGAGGGSVVSPLTGIGFGIGLKLNYFSLDYTFSPYGDLGDVQRVTVGARW